MELIDKSHDLQASIISLECLLKCIGSNKFIQFSHITNSFLSLRNEVFEVLKLYKTEQCDNWNYVNILLRKLGSKCKCISRSMYPHNFPHGRQGAFDMLNELDLIADMLLSL